MKSQSRVICSANTFVRKFLTVGFLITLCLPSAPLPVSALVVNSTFNQINLTANIETIGVVVTGASLPKTAALLYREAGEATWHEGHPLMRIDNARLAGSLFGLSPATAYEIKVIDGSTEITGSTTTQPDELQFTPATVLYVDDDGAPGGGFMIAITRPRSWPERKRMRRPPLG